MRSSTRSRSGSSAPVRSVSTSRPSPSRRSTTAQATSSKSGDDATAVSSTSPRYAPFANRDAVQLDVARGDRHLAGRDVPERVEHRALVLGRVGRRQVADDRREAGGNRARRDHAHRLRRHGCGLLRREDHVRVVRQDEHLGRRRRLDCGEEIAGRRVHRLAALEHARRPVALEQPPVPAPGTTATTPVSSVCPRIGNRFEQPLRALDRLTLHVRDLDSLDRAERSAERERPARLVRVDMDLQSRRIADDEQRVAEALQLVLERARVEALTFDDEHRAVAVLRLLQMDGVDARDVCVLGRRLGQGLPASAAARPRTSSRSPAPPASTTPASRRTASCSGVRARASSPRSTSRFEQLDRCERGIPRVLRLLGQLPQHRQDRALHRMEDLPVGGVGRGAEGAPNPRGIDQALLREHLHRAAQDLREDHARVPAAAHQRRPRQLLRERGAVRRARGFERLHDRARGERQVRAGVAVGHGIDVQVVDPLPVCLERPERRTGELACPLQLGRLHEIGPRHRGELNRCGRGRWPREDPGRGRLTAPMIRTARTDLARRPL